MRTVLPLVFLGACGFSVPGSNSQTPSDGKLSDGAGSGSDGSVAMPDAPPDAYVGCPISFVDIPAAGTGSKYLAFDKQSQIGAINTCSGYNTHLLHLDTNAEATALEAYINGSFSSGDTGLYRVVGARDPVFRSVWHELDWSIMTFLPWGANEPTDFIGEDCMVLKKEASVGKTGADQCLTQHEFACECDP